MRYVWFVVLGVVTSIGLYYLWHRHYPDTAVVTDEVRITIDTLVYNDIAPDSITPPSIFDSLPIYHFSDSVGGVWHAEVAGRDVELRSLVLRERYESRQSRHYTSPKWEVTARGAISPTSNWVGVGVERNVGRLKLSLGAGYAPLDRTPYVEGSVGFVLWREW